MPASASSFTPPAGSGNFLYVVVEGLVRFYHVDDEGEEVRPVTAVALGLPSGCQALEPSTLLVANYEALAAPFRGSLTFERFDHNLSRTMLTWKERPLWALQNLAAAERIADFASRFPELNSRVPQYHIASYLGMSSVSSSRLKKKAARS